MFVITVMGMIVYGIHTQSRPDDIVHYANGGRVSLQGIVLTQPEKKTNGKRVSVSFVLEAQDIVRSRQGRREYLVVNGKVQIFLMNSQTMPELGDKVRLFGELSGAPEPKNPGQFDYKNYLENRGIQTLLNGYGNRSMRVMQSHKSRTAAKAVVWVRKGIAKRIDSLFSKDYSPIYKALLLGMKRDLSPSLRDHFMKTGTAHLLAISGLHMTLIGGSLFYLLLAIRMEQKIAALLALCLIVFYIFVAGAGIPVRRAGVMSAILFAALFMERENHFMNAYFLAFFLIIWFGPKDLFNLSFHLSFLSVLSIGLLFPRTKEEWVWRQSIMRSLAVTLGTLPVVLYHFNVFSSVSIIANLLAIPIFHFAILTAVAAISMAAVPLLGFAISSISSFIMSVGLTWIQYLAALEWAYVFIPSPNAVQIFLYYFLLLIICVLFRLKHKHIVWARALIGSMWIVVLGTMFIVPNNHSFQMTVLAAGKNEMAHIQFSEDTHWLLNTGRGKPSDQGRWIVAPYLRYRGINHLNAIVFTDHYKRHTGGLSSILSNVSVDTVYYPQKFVKNRTKIDIESLRSRGVHAIGLKAGSHIEIEGGGGMKVLAIENGKAAIMIYYRALDILILPNVDEGMMRKLDTVIKDLEVTDIVIFPAFKRKQRMSGETLHRMSQAFDPEIAIFQSPHAQLSDYFNERDIQVLDAENSGAITLSLDKNSRSLTIEGTLIPTPLSFL